MAGGVTCGDGLPHGPVDIGPRGPNEYELQLIIWILFIIGVVIFQRCF